ncbi:MAG: site-2 protease family protein [Nitrospiraceae bacterium]|nr:site-2 protease family protein [Nitrospiraceae bacterium]
MKWSWKIGKIAGIGVYMHATFLILIGWVVLSHWTAGHTLGYAMVGVAFILALFACVVLHELGHALTARRYGIETQDIILLPIGGMARLERMPEDPRQELRVALAGPAVSMVIAAALFVWIRITESWEPLNTLSVAGGPFMQRLMVVNIVLAIFNVLPAFPMDGGRVLRSFLALRMDYARATRLAATMGQGMAFVFGFIGFFTNPFLLFIAFFVWIGAVQEAGMVETRSAVGGIPVSKAMITEFHSLSPNDPLSRAIEFILRGTQQDFPVAENERMVGVLTKNNLLVALAKGGQGLSVGEVMSHDFQIVEASEMLERVLAKLQASEGRILLVLQEGSLVGLITMDNVGEFIAIQSALGKAKGGK